MGGFCPQQRLKITFLKELTPNNMKYSKMKNKGWHILFGTIREKKTSQKHSFCIATKAVAKRDWILPALETHIVHKDS